MADLLIQNGLVIDGSGSPGFHASVIVDDERVAIRRGKLPEIDAARTIDATGLVVCPGFIDLHSHAGLTILGAPHHDPKVRQGVTTELVGIDGISHAPFKSRDELHRYIWLDSGLNGYPPMPADWLTVAEYLGKYDNSVAINIAYILGNNPVRIWSVGWNDVPATPAQIAEMQSIVRESMEEGAWGLSTGLDYEPGAYADTDELVGPERDDGTHGRLLPHPHPVGPAGGEPAGPLRGGRGDRAAQRMPRPPHPLPPERAGRGQPPGLHRARGGRPRRGDGRDLRLLQLPLLGHPPGDRLPEVEQGRRAGAAHGRAQRPRRSRPAQAGDSARRRWTIAGSPTSPGPENRAYEGRLLTDIAGIRGTDPWETMFDLLLEENLGVSSVSLGTNQHTLAAFVSHPYGMIASDAIVFGEYPNPRTYGCFPLVLAEFVRAEKHLRLPEAIRKMTSFPAQRLGIPDRGLLRDGFRADIVLFDPAAVKTTATREDPKQYPVGIEYVIVNGRVVIECGENTRALPGRALRRGRAST